MRKFVRKLVRLDTPQGRLVLLSVVLAVLGVVYLKPRLVEAQLSTLSFAPEADSYVDSSAPTSNKGTATQVRLDASPTVVTYLRFNVAGVGSSISSATLKIYVNSNHSAGFQVRQVSDNSWTETGINYNNRPAYGSTTVASSGSLVSGAWKSVDVTPVVTANGQVTFALVTTSSTAASLASRESGNIPLLEVVSSNVSGTPVPTPDPTPVVTPTPISATPTPVITPSPTPVITPTPVAGTDPVIVAAGDIACGAGSGGARCQQSGTASLIGQINPNGVLLLGDNQYEKGSLSDFNNYYHPTWGQYKSITFPSVGNHEYLTSGAAGYFDYFNGVGNPTGPAGDRSKGYYAYDLGNWRLYALNTNCSKAGGCGTSSPQYKWLQADLAANKGKCFLAYAHHPKFTSGQQPLNSGVAPLFQALYDGHADVFLVGHDHNYERFVSSNPSGQPDPNGIVQFVVGTGGRNFTHLSSSGLKPNSAVFNDTTFGLLKMTLKPTSYDYEFVPAPGVNGFKNGTFTESGSVNCHLVP